MQNRGISQAVIRRLPRYYRYLGELIEQGVERISSNELSKRMKVTASQIRQDLNNFGGFGQQGYGYNVPVLRDEIAKILGLDQKVKSILIGVGNLGRVIVNHMDFEARGFNLIALFDNNPKIIVSRTSENFLRRLFELEVPEIHDGLITIHKVARIPGERAKIAVESYDERIDPVGACVGVKGSRIHGIVRELRNENIDVINYTTNTSLFIQRALNPAKISSIRLNEEEKKAEVFLKPEEVSLAIGKGGLNIKLASMLTGYTIDVYRDIDEGEEEDIYLDEFKDEIDEWVIEALKSIGCATAKSVLAKSREELIEGADLEEDTVDEVIKILKAEFDETDEEA